MGMLGCGLQLGDDGEISRRDTTVTLDASRPEVQCFFGLEGVEVSNFSPLNISRISILQMEEYIVLYPEIVEYLRLYERNRFLRLGNRARVPAWNLSSRESYIVRMSDDDFHRHFVSDPRMRMTMAGILNPNLFLHPPILIGEGPDGLPPPDQGAWGRLTSCAAQQ